MARKKKTAKETILSLIPKLSKYEFEEVDDLGNEARGGFGGTGR